MSVAAIVLAAGASTRLGSPKQLATLNGETLLDRTVRVARDAGCSPIVVVLGASAAEIRAATSLGDAIIVDNAQWAAGMGGSIALGARALMGAAACVVLTCDMPAVTSSHLMLLMENEMLTASSYAGRRGVPAYFPAKTTAMLEQLHGDAGARELLKDAATVELTGGELDVDTVEQLEQARRVFDLKP